MFKTCKNCQQNLEITDEDLKFYDKISPIFTGKKYSLPPPNLCPDCRSQQRMQFRNFRNLYNAKSALSGEKIISMYHPQLNYKVYSINEWWSDQWEGLNFGQEYSFDKDFFEQFYDLQLKVTKLPLKQLQCEACEYSNFAFKSQNCYLVFGCVENQDCLYGHIVWRSKDCLDGLYIYECNFCYECLDCVGCYKSYFSTECVNCAETWFCHYCLGCNNCFGSTNLKQKSWYWNNEYLGKEKYLEKFKKISPLNYKTIKQAKQDLSLRKKNQTVFPEIFGNLNENVTGNHIYFSKNLTNCFDAKRCENCKFLYTSQTFTDCYDCNFTPGNCELSYNCLAVGDSRNLINCREISNSTNLIYCYECQNCHDCFGCDGLKYKNYCILNKQYSKEEYEKLVPKIIEAMKSPKSPLTRGLGHPLDKGGLGDCEWNNFPAKYLSVFTYNETAAQDYFPLTKEEAITKGFKWCDFEPEFPKVEKIISANLLPDSISKIPDDILNWAIECEVMKKPFKIIAPELDFYRQMNLPIPRRHPDQRHKDRMALRNPRKLWKRNCMKCNSEIQTTYSPERPEIVYCEKCYLEKVY